MHVSRPSLMCYEYTYIDQNPSPTNLIISCIMCLMEKGRKVLYAFFFFFFSKDLNKRKQNHKQALWWCANGMYNVDTPPDDAPF